MKKYLLLLLLLPILFVCTNKAQAAVGVGVGTGKIIVDEVLRPGVTYELPEVLVFNTGDVASKYKVSIEWSDRESLAKPPKEWFSFKEETFYLEPGESKAAYTKITLPLNDVVPGDYYALVVAEPVTEIESGVTSVGVAAGSKLYFTVRAANLIQAIYYKVAGVFMKFMPWSAIILSLLVLILLFLKFRKNFKIEIVQKKEQTKS